MAPQYGLDPQRYAQVDVELRRTLLYFERLRAEISAAAAPDNQAGWTDRRVAIIIESIERLRADLAREQPRRQRRA